MDNGNRPAFPIYILGDYEEPGLTKRELFAKDLACALMASGTWTLSEAVTDSVKWADELLAELEK